MAIEQFSSDGSRQEKINDYEGDHLAYAELGKGEDFDKWGSVAMTNEDGSREWASFYGDERVTQRLFTNSIISHLNKDNSGELILTDFGGGDGIMLRQIHGQLLEAGLKTKPILLDLDEKKLQQAAKTNPEINPIISDLAQVPLQANSVDVGASRFAMQYLPRPFDRDKPLPDWMPKNNIVVKEQFERDGYVNQYDVLKEMFRVLKPGACIVLVWPGAYGYTSEEQKKRADNISYFWNRVTSSREFAKTEDRALITDETFVSLERWFTAGEEMASFAKKLVLKLRKEVKLIGSSFA